MAFSTAHEQLTREEFERTTPLDAAWDNPQMAAQQRELVDGELARFRAGEDVAPFRVLLELVRTIVPPPRRVLEVGCSSGYYHAVLEHGGWRGEYLGIDRGAAFIDLARQHHPGADFAVGDAVDLVGIGQYDLVISGACLMHVRRWPAALTALTNATRLGGHLLLHRTPLDHSGATTYWRKEAYGVPCAEIHFGAEEFLAELAICELRVVAQQQVGVHDGFNMQSYLCRREG